VVKPDITSHIQRLRERFPRVAITHEWLTIPGGSEKVVLELLELFPHAEIFTSVYDPEPWPEAITSRPVHPSWLNKLPGATRIYPKLLPLMNSAFESFDVSRFDLVVSSNHSCAKNVITPPGTLHLCYCHTPMRYAWDPRFLHDEQLGVPARMMLRFLLPRLRRQDLAASTRPDAYAANSTHVAARIAKYYRRGATVIHPPVDVDRFLGVERAPEDWYLVFGRVVPYKRVDLAVAACTRLGRRLKVVGTGRDLDRVRALAGEGVEFLGHVPDGELPALVGRARALLFPGEEDFGIVPVEVQAAGVPVIAYGVGGVQDSVADRETGILFAEQTVESLCEAIEDFETIEAGLDTERIRDNARGYSPQTFREQFADFALEKAVVV
jgi:glycosyltransferase involved in cell wall biosynthesis